MRRASPGVGDGRMTRALAAAVLLGALGPLVVLVAYGHAGGGDRPRPHPACWTRRESA